MRDKSEKHERRVRRSRRKIIGHNAPYVIVHRTLNNIHAQLYAPRGAQVLAAASSVEKEIKAQLEKGGGKIKVSEMVGKLIAERAQAKGITKVAFDRSGYKYHGRVKAVAEAMRANGLTC